MPLRQVENRKVVFEIGTEGSRTLAVFGPTLGYTG